MTNRSCKNKKNVKNPKRKSLKKKGGGKVKELLQQWDELSNRIFDPDEGGSDGLIPINDIIEHLQETDISIINHQDTNNMTIFHELVKRFFNKEEANYGLFLQEEFQVGIFGDVPPTYSYRNTFHYATRRCFKLILELLSRYDLEINTQSENGQAAINHLIEYYYYSF